MNGTKRENIKQGAQVRVVIKQDQRSGKLTEGVGISTFKFKVPQHTGSGGQHAAHAPYCRSGMDFYFSIGIWHRTIRNAGFGGQ